MVQSFNVSKYHKKDTGCMHYRESIKVRLTLEKVLFVFISCFVIIFSNKVDFGQPFF